MRKQLTAAVLLSTSFFFLMGSSEKKKHTSVEAQSAVKGKTVELDFKVNFDRSTLQISKEGPWTLQLVNTKGLKLETKDGKFESRTLDESLPGFKVKTELDGAAAAGKVDFTLKAFVCTNNKTQCYFEQHKGSLDWKQS